jgi:hypothetical protein
LRRQRGRRPHPPALHLIVTFAGFATRRDFEGGVTMRIIAVVADGHGRIRVAATRAPDIFRRDIAAQTGTAHLVWCAVAPAELGARQFIGTLDASLARARTAGGYVLPARMVISTARRLLLAHRVRCRLRAAARPLRRRLVALLRRPAAG